MRCATVDAVNKHERSPSCIATALTHAQHIAAASLDHAVELVVDRDVDALVDLEVGLSECHLLGQHLLDVQVLLRVPFVLGPVDHVGRVAPAGSRAVMDHIRDQIELGPDPGRILAVAEVFELEVLHREGNLGSVQGAVPFILLIRRIIQSESSMCVMALVRAK